MSFVRRLSRHVALSLMGARGLAPALRAFGRGLLSIFTMHRFANPDLGTTGHDPVVLRDNLAYLRRHRYRLLSLSDVLSLLDEGQGVTTPAVAFTVDDGYAGFAHTAAPIFAEFDCPVTLFVTTGFLDGQLWMWWDRATHVFSHTRRHSFSLDTGSECRTFRWSTLEERNLARQDVLSRLEWLEAADRERAIAALARDLDVELPASPPPEYAPISWDDVRRTAKLGATFGPHTVTHPILSLSTEDVCTWEIRESYRRLREETDAYVPIFCYPNGEPRAVGAREVAVAQREGFKAALTTVPDYAVMPQRGHSATCPFLLPRFPYPDDLAHLVHTVAGFVRIKRAIEGRRGIATLRASAAVSTASRVCAG